MPSATPSRRTPATEVRANLIHAGRRILERDGVAGLTVRSVAKEAGVAPMGVYNHFDGKEGLLDALVSDAFAEFGHNLRAVTDSDPAARLAHSGRAYRDFALAYPIVYELMFSSECQPDAETAQGAFTALSDIVQYGQAAGVIRTGDAAVLAMQVWSCAHGAVSLELAGALPPLLDPAANYEGVLALIANGLRP